MRTLLGSSSFLRISNVSMSLGESESATKLFPSSSFVNLTNCLLETLKLKAVSLTLHNCVVDGYKKMPLINT